MPEPMRLQLVFGSAAVFASERRPRIELPAPIFEVEHPPRGAEKAEYTLEVIEGDEETLRERYLGSVGPRHILLVLSAQGYQQLLTRLHKIRTQPLKAEFTLDEHGQLLEAALDGRPIQQGPLYSTVTGRLDLEVEGGESDEATG
jgi:hypothetical protein